MGTDIVSDPAAEDLFRQVKVHGFHMQDVVVPVLGNDTAVEGNGVFFRLVNGSDFLQRPLNGRKAASGGADELDAFFAGCGNGFDIGCRHFFLCVQQRFIQVAGDQSVLWFHGIPSSTFLFIVSGSRFSRGKVRAIGMKLAV